MKSEKILKSYFQLSYPLMIAKLFVKKKILGNFCTIYNIFRLSSFEYGL